MNRGDSTNARNRTETSESHPQPKRSYVKRPWIWFILLCLVVGGAFAVWEKQQLPASPASGKSGNKASSLPTPVFVAPARLGDLNLYLTGLGSVTPLNNVTVRSRVDGQLMAVHFREGQNVTKGSLLAVIDPRPFQVQLTQADGQMARDPGTVEQCPPGSGAVSYALETDSIPRQQLDTQASLVRQFEGAVQIDQAQVESAKLNLIYSRITAPISGRVGLRVVDAGNMVRATDAGGLLTITQVQPICGACFRSPRTACPRSCVQTQKGGAGLKR